MVTLILALAGCATPQGRMAGETFGRGLLNLVLAPFMIVGGVLQGLAFLPYTLGLGLNELNRSLLEAQAVSLDDSYRATFGVALTDPRVDQKTGEVQGETVGFGRYRPEALAEATQALQRLLVSQGMPGATAQHYVLGADYSQARSRGHVLLALMYRHPGPQPFRVVSKHTGIATTLRPHQLGWRAPYEKDVDGNAVDEVVDWVALEYTWLRQDKVVATLMALGVESVKTGKRAPDYWAVERRWLAGESTAILKESAGRVSLEVARR